MANHSTYDDANLILRLYELRREERMRAARKWFMESFGPETLADFRALCPPGSENNASFRQVSTYYEMVASFITSGVLNEELYFQSGGFLFKTQRTGAFFYVLAEKAAEARVFLESKGYKPQPALPVEG